MKEDTGTYSLRAEFTNPTAGRFLIPDMTVDVRLPLGEPKAALLVADQAVGEDLDQKYVIVLNEKNEAEKRSVTAGTLFDGLRVIEKGLKGDERVIVVGRQNALRPDVTLEPKEVAMQDYAATTGPRVVPPRRSLRRKKRSRVRSSAAPTHRQNVASLRLIPTLSGLPTPARLPGR